jgi:ankyrin repeat protein
MWAAMRQSPEGAKALVAAGAELDTRNRADRSALTIAALRGHLLVVQTLLRLGARVVEADMEQLARQQMVVRRCLPVVTGGGGGEAAASRGVGKPTRRMCTCLAQRSKLTLPVDTAAKVRSWLVGATPWGRRRAVLLGLQVWA